MKRQIKFRGKVVHNDPMVNPPSGWVDGFYYQDLDKGEIAHFIFNCPMTWQVREETVGQFTGLVDKNGKEVYEGDVLRAKEFENDFMHEDDDFLDAFPLDELKGDLKKEYVSQVRFEDGGFILEIPDCIISLCAFFGNMKKSRPIFECEVIGNIHDNPELIEVNKKS